MEFYKPNKGSTGSGCSWSFTASAEGDKAFFLELIKQKSFSNGKATFDQDKKTCIKLSLKEIGGFIRVISNTDPVILNGKVNDNVDQKASYFHKSTKGSKQINFTKTTWNDAVLYGLSVSVSEKEKDIFRISFDPDEAFLLKEYLKFGLERIFLAMRQEQKKKFSDSQKNKSE